MLGVQTSPKHAKQSSGKLRWDPSCEHAGVRKLRYRSAAMKPIEIVVFGKTLTVPSSRMIRIEAEPAAKTYTLGCKAGVDETAEHFAERIERDVRLRQHKMVRLADWL